MEYIYPAFEQGRIMKKELLEALRDYSYSGWWLKYREYPDGIIKGCDLMADGRDIIISPGIIKSNQYVFMLKETERVAYEPTEQYVSLKFRAEPVERFTDYSRYVAEFTLDDCLERKGNEVELCRYKLKSGSQLRYEYKDLYDIQTEFDTLNLADATWAGKGGNTLSKAVTDYFARAVLQCGQAEWPDAQFAYMCLQNEYAMDREVLRHYLCYRQGSQVDEDRNSDGLFHDLVELLNAIRNNKDFSKRRIEENNRVIIVE